MGNSVRIRTTPNGNDKYLKVNLEQDFDFIEILSIKISQEEAYRNYCSDYGVVVGRVIVNNGFGVPNAKVSIFIPIDEVDSQNPTLKALYPYEVVIDKNSDGIRYNLLTNTNDTNNKCFTPVGTFPSKREMLDNETMLSLYCKYYKFTTTTNNAGDFMIFGVPLGNHILHIDADISDIGSISQRPYDLIREGSSPKLFDSPNKFKGGNNLDKMPQIKTVNVGVNVQPFWGDPETCQIGITRADANLNYTVTPSAIFMGGIFGDQAKNSINKRCRPRKKIGLFCEQVTGPGMIEMIRKNINGEIEDFDIEGGQLIDDNGTWAYQIPMNLDYMLTDEEGNLVPSDDENVGIPTRANVRFKIGMDETGGEGRLRTRAKFLVPNNPYSKNDIDYNFGTKTKPNSFKDLYWNKIYTVSNFISRFQTAGGVNNKNMIGMKNVDDCAGDKTPFPFNRVDTDVNPIFSIICLIIKIIAFLIYVMNSFIIPAINAVFKILNTIIGGIVDMVNQIISFVCDLINYIPLAPSCGLSPIIFNEINYIGCLTVKCPTDDDPSYFAPGCQPTGGLDGGEAFNAAEPQPDYYCNDAQEHKCTLIDNAVGLDDCMAFQMAQSLNMFQFDFYNDWVNGSLYSFLLKYKKRRRSQEKFCEYDCDDFVGESNYSGVDGNQNGKPDNNCRSNFLLDSCVVGEASPTDDNVQKEKNESGTLREGLVKKYENEFYYAATTHNAAYKLFATDIICLGSILKDDWQGVPNLQQYLIPSTYKIPPEIQELDDDNSLLSCGMVDIGGNTKGLFFGIDCLGLHVNRDQCLNIRHICEFGVDTDESTEDPITGSITQADCNIGASDINEISKEFRDAFTLLNNGTINPIFTTPLDTDFNLENAGYYDFTAGPSVNGIDYINFRGYDEIALTNYQQPKHSFFMYFGLLPGKSALEKMNIKYFNECKYVEVSDFIIDTSTTPNTGLTTDAGSITFSFNGGFPQFTYTVTNSNGDIIDEGTTSETNNIITINGLAEGIYVISATDALSNPVVKEVSVTGPPSLYCSVSVTNNISNLGATDGEITVTSLGGGQPPYTYTLSDTSNEISTDPVTQLQTFNNLGLGVYTVDIVDSALNHCITTGLTITGPSVINLSVTPTNVSCYNGNNGSLNISVTGGIPPYSLNTTGTNTYTTQAIINNLIVGSYTTTVVDSYGTTAQTTTNITNLAPQLITSAAQPSILEKQCDPNNYKPSFIINNYNYQQYGSSVYVEYSTDNGDNWSLPILVNVTGSTQVITFSVDNSLPLIPRNSVSSSVVVRFSNTSDGLCRSNSTSIPKNLMTLPNSQLTATKTQNTSNTNNWDVTTSGGIGSITFYSNSNGTSAIINNGSSATINFQPYSVVDSVGCTVNI
jgi:hypothetical protein